MKVLDVQKLIEDQSQRHKDRLLSQYSRLLDSAPSFPTYFSIDGVNSTSEIGTRAIMEYVGRDSPVKFKKIENMPIYSLDVINAEITYDEQLGTFTEYDGEGLILQSVLRPLPGDHFIVPEFNPEIIFIVTDVRIRAVRGEDHYVINYTVVPTSRVLNIELQVIEHYETIFRNIGTEDNVLIRRDDYHALREYMESYNILMERYIDENYDTEIGYLKTPEWLTDDIGYGTCKYLIKFLMDNRVIYFDEIFETIFAFETVLKFDARHNKLYNRTFPLLNFLKDRKDKIPMKSSYVSFMPLPVSLFKDVYDEKIEQSIEFLYLNDNPPDGEDFVLPYKSIRIYSEDFIRRINENNIDEASPTERVIIKFMNKEHITPSELSDVADDYEVDDIFRFYFIPLVLLITKVKIKSLQAGRNI